MAELCTTIDVMEALGGTDAVAQLTNRKYTAAFNWRGFETFPPDTFVVLTEALKTRGHTAPSSLWRMVGAESTQAAS